MSVVKLLLAVGGALSIAVVVLVVLAALKRLRPASPEPPPPPIPTSLSFLAGFSFFSGLGAMALVVTAAVFFSVLSMGEVLQVDSDVRVGLTLAAKIVLYVSLLPGVAAIAFALAARGVISEGGGSVRGKPLYRTGVLLAILSGAVVLDARVINPSTWASLGQRIVSGAAEDPEIHRGYLGVETGPLDTPDGCPILRVVPGSPADRAGLKAGDKIAKIDGTPIHQLPPLGSPGASSWSPMDPYISSYIGSLKPGVKVAIQFRRGKETMTATVELSASFDSLLALLEQQSFDHERLDVLKAAGPDRRYSAEELMKICQAFDFDAGRLKAIESALPRLQDPQNAFGILKALEFSDSKSRASGWIRERAKTPPAPKDE